MTNPLSKNTLCLIAVYLIFNLPWLFLGEAKYWDDWILIGVSKSDLIETFKEAGYIEFGYIHNYIREIGTYQYRILGFFVCAVPALIIVKTGEGLGLNKNEIFWVALLMIVLPLNFQRVAAVNVATNLSISIFFIAWLFIESVKSIRSGILFFVPCITLMWASFSYQAVFALLMIAIIGNISSTERSEGKNVRLGMYITSALFFLLRYLTFSPHGNYENYNSINFNLIQIIKNSYIYIANILDVTEIQGCLFLILFFGLMLIHGSGVAKKRVLTKTKLGIIYFVIVALPYIVSNKVPAYQDWGGRLQIFQPIGISMFVVGYISDRKQKIHPLDNKIKKLLVSFFVLACFMLNLSNYIAYEVDWLKQVAIVEQLKTVEYKDGYRAVIFTDSTVDINAYRRTYRFYEVAGMLKDAGFKNISYVGSTYEIVSAERAGGKFSEIIKGDRKYSNGKYLLNEPSRSDLSSNSLLNLEIISAPTYSLSKLELAIKAWRFKFKGEHEKYINLSRSVVIVCGGVRNINNF